MSLKLEIGINKLIESHRYFGEVIQRMKRKKENKIPTMGVSYENQSIVLYYNEHFLNSLTHDETAGVLNHECNHVIGEHIEREILLEPDFDRRKAMEKDAPMSETMEKYIKANLLNVCEDVAINQWIPNIPMELKSFDKDGNPVLDTREVIVDEKALKKYLNKGYKLGGEEELKKFHVKNPNFNKPMVGEPCTLQSFRKMLPDNTKVKEKQPFEYYYNLLKQEGHDKKTLEKAMQSLEKAIMTLDQHDMGEASEGKNETDTEARKEIAKSIANEALKATEEAGMAGSIPGHVLEQLDALNKKPKNWKQDISKFAARASSVLKEITRNRRNRRQRQGEPLVPGYRNKAVLKLIFAMDTSGSMSSEILEQIASEARKLHEMGVQLLLIECDSQINNVRKYQGEKNLEVHGRGGTLFNPVFELINSKKFGNEWGEFDGIIFFTDGDCFENNVIKPKMPILWAMNKGCKPPVNWGWSTEIIINEK